MDHPSSDNDTTGKQVVFWGREAPESKLSLRSRGPALPQSHLHRARDPLPESPKSQGSRADVWVLAAEFTSPARFPRTRGPE